MAITVQTLLNQDDAPTRVSKSNANFAALATVSGMDQALSADTSVADNRSQVTAGFVTVASTYTLSILGTGILAIL